jgi:sugar lactone lactonase YvrE
MLSNDWMKSWTRRAARLLPLLAILALLAPFAPRAAAATQISGVPAVITYGASTYPGALSSGNNLVYTAPDSCGNVYAMQLYGGNIYEFPFGGGTPSLAVAGWGQGWSGSQNLYMDAAKANIYVSEGPNGGGEAARIPIVNCALQPGSMLKYNAPNGVAAGGNVYWWCASAMASDAAGDVFIGTTGNTLFELDNTGNPLPLLLTGPGLSSTIVSMAVDANNNVFFAMGNAIYELPYSNGGYGANPTPVLVPSALTYTNLVGITFDSAGNLYVTDQGPQYQNNATLSVIPNVSNGTTSALAPADQYIIVQHVNAQSPLGIGTTGNLYYGNWGSSVYELALNTANAGSAAVGNSATATVYVEFSASVTPQTISFTTGSAFSVSGGTCATGTAYTAGQSCTIIVKFSPTRPGNAAAGMTLADAGGHVLSTTYLAGTGTGPGLTIDPGMVTSLGSGFAAPNEVAANLSGSYVADAGKNSVFYFATPISSPVSIGTGLSKPSGVAVDAFGNVLIADTGNNQIVEVPMVSGALSNAAQVTIISSATSVAGSKLSGPTGLTLDPLGNLYIADTGNNRIVLVPYNGSWDAAQAFTLGSNLTAPLATAVTAAGSVYVADSGAGSIYFLNGGNQTLIAVGYSNPSALAVDPSGALFVVDQGAQTILRIPSIAGALEPNSAIEVGLGVANPYGVAIDPTGNLVVTDTIDAAAYEINRITVTDSFGDWPLNTASNALPVQVEDEGNASLTFAAPYYTGTGNTGDFLMGTSSPSDCANSESIGAGASCQIVPSFLPTAAGSRTETLVFNSNASNAPAPQVVLNGSGLAATATTTVLALTSPASGTVSFGEPLALQATVAAASGTPSGTVELLVDGVLTGEATLSSKGIAAFSLPTGLNGGSHTLQAIYLGSASFNGSAGSLTLSVGTAATTLTLAINSPNTNPYSSTPGTAVSFTATVNFAGVGIPTGTVVFATGSTALGTANVVPGAGGLFQASITTTALALGSNPITATYSGDANYLGSTVSGGPVVVVTGATLVLTSSGTTLTSATGSYGENNSSIVFSNTSEGGWAGIVAYHCLASSLPANALCVFSPGQVIVTPSTPSASYPSVAYQTQLQIIINNPPNSPGQSSMLWWLGGISGLLLFFTRRRFMRGVWGTVTMLIGIVLLGVSACGLMACNNGVQYVTPAGTSTVTVYADADPYASGSTTATQPCGTIPGSNPPMGSPALAPCSQQVYQISLTVQ